MSGLLRDILNLMNLLIPVKGWPFSLHFKGVPKNMLKFKIFTSPRIKYTVNMNSFR